MCNLARAYEERRGFSQRGSEKYPDAEAEAEAAEAMDHHHLHERHLQKKRGSREMIEPSRH